MLLKYDINIRGNTLRVSTCVVVDLDTPSISQLDVIYETLGVVYYQGMLMSPVRRDSTGVRYTYEFRIYSKGVNESECHFYHDLLEVLSL